MAKIMWLLAVCITAGMLCIGVAVAVQTIEVGGYTVIYEGLASYHDFVGSWQGRIPDAYVPYRTVGGNWDYQG